MNITITFKRNKANPGFTGGRRCPGFNPRRVRDRRAGRRYQRYSQYARSSNTAMDVYRTMTLGCKTASLRKVAKWRDPMTISCRGLHFPAPPPGPVISLAQHKISSARRR